MYTALPQILLNVMLLILAVFRTLKQSIDMYNATKQWQPNRYMNQLTRDGTSYFIMYVSVSFSNICSNLIVLAKHCSNIFAIIFAVTVLRQDITNILSAICSSLLCCLTPRFIISVRELYDRDLRGLRQGIDTGFGVLSQSLSGENARISTILFADTAGGESWTGQRDEDEQGGIRLEVIRANSHHV